MLYLFSAFKDHLGFWDLPRTPDVSPTLAAAGIINDCCGCFKNQR